MAARLGGGGIDPVEKPVQADSPVRRCVLLVQADVGHFDAVMLSGKLLDETQPSRNHLLPLDRGGVPVAAAGAGLRKGSEFGGSQFKVGGDAVAGFQAPAPVEYPPVEPVPGPGVHAEGGTDVMPEPLGLHCVVDSHIAYFLLMG